MDMSCRVDKGEARTSRILLSPTVEPIKYLEVKSGTQADNYSIVRASQVPSLLQLKDIAFPSSLSALQYALKPVITSAPQMQQLQVQQQQQPQSQSNSRPASPYSRRPSPPRSAAPVFSRGVIDSLKKTNDILNQEVSKLQGQVRSLKQKSEAQDAEIRKLKTSSDEASSSTADRSSKFVRATQAIRMIAHQLNDIAEKLPPEISETESLKAMHGQVAVLLDSMRDQSSEAGSSSANMPPEPTSEPVNDFERTDNAREDHTLEDQVHGSEAQDMSNSTNGTLQEASASSVSHANEPAESGSSTPQSSQSERRMEVIEQFEPGVYVTLTLLSNGTKVFKHVRFSKRRFAAQEAEEWWKENKDRLLKKYSPSKAVVNLGTEVGASAQPLPEEANQTTQTQETNGSA